MRRILLAAFLSMIPAMSEGHGYGVPVCSYQQAANYGIIRHTDGTFWNQQATIQYELGAIQDYTSPTGWRQYFYALPFKPTVSAIQGYTPIAQQGQTIYGYTSTETASYGVPSYRESAAVYSPDYSQFLNQAYRLASQSQELATSSYGGFLNSTTLLNANQQELAKMQATKETAVAVLQAARGQSPEQVQRTISLTIGPDAHGKLTVKTADQEPVIDHFMTVVAQHCDQCHGHNSKNAEARKLLRLEEYSNWTPRTFAAIAEQVEKDKMPKEGSKLTRSEKAAVYAMESYVSAGNKPPPVPPIPPPPQEVR